MNHKYREHLNVVYASEYRSVCATLNDLNTAEKLFNLKKKIISHRRNALITKKKPGITTIQQFHRRKRKKTGNYLQCFSQYKIGGVEEIYNGVTKSMLPQKVLKDSFFMPKWLQTLSIYGKGWSLLNTWSIYPWIVRTGRQNNEQDKKHCDVLVVNIVKLKVFGKKIIKLNF